MLWNSQAPVTLVVVAFAVVLSLILPVMAMARSATPVQDSERTVNSPASMLSRQPERSSLVQFGSSHSSPTEEPPRPIAATLPAASVLRTLILANHSLEPGNQVPLNGSYPEDLSIDVKDAKLYVATEGGLVVVVNTTTDRLVDTIPVPGGFWGIAYDSHNGKVYAAEGFGGNNVTVIDSINDTVVDRISVQSLPEAVTVDTATGRVFVMNTGSHTVSVINDSTNLVVGTISVGNGPISGGLDTANGNLFISNYQSNNVSIIDTATDRVIGSASVGVSPAGIAYDPVSGDMYVVDTTPSFPPTADGYVTVLNGTTGALVTTIKVGICPYGAAFDNATNEVYVTDTECATMGNVTVVSAATNTVTATINTGWDSTPTPVVYDAANRLVYAANYFATNVSIINGTLHRVVGTVGAGELPTDLAYDPRNGIAYVADSGGNEVAVVNGSTGAEVGSIGSWYGPDGLAYDSANGNLYVADYFSDNVSVIDTITGKIIASISVGSYPEGVGYDPANGDVYVANCNSDNVSVIDGLTNTVLNSIAAGVCPNEVTFDSTNGDLYVTNVGPKVEVYGTPGNVTVIDGASNRAIASVGTGTGPWGAAFDPTNGFVYVACFITGNLTVIDGAHQTTVESIHVGLYPTDPAYDPQVGEVFVATGRSGNLTNSNELVAVEPANGSLLGEVTVGTSPLDIGVDPLTDELLATNLYSGTISILSPTSYPPARFGVTFDETGLVRGLSWSITLNGTVSVSTTQTLGFSETNGEYSYSIAPVTGYLLVSSSNGSITIADQNVTVLLKFAELYFVQLAESGLPGNFSWTVVWNGSTVVAAAGTLFSFQATNGTYRYTVSPVRGYVPTPANGTIVVSGLDVAEAIQFVGPRPSVLSLLVSPRSGPVGTTFTLTPAVSGGVGALTYLYFGLPGGCANANVTALICRPAAAGNTTVEVIVTDSLGRFSSANATIHVTAVQITQPHGSSTGPTLLGLPWDLGVALVAASVLLAASVTGVLFWRWRARTRIRPD